MSRAQTAVDLPARWIAGITVASAAACVPLAVAVAAAGIRLYERLAGHGPSGSRPSRSPLVPAAPPP